MKYLAALLIAISLLTTVPVGLSQTFSFQAEVAEAAVSVKGYYRKNGTYVAPHYRSNPDGNPYNNYSFPGNTNPFTGKTATGNPSTYLKNYGGSSYTPSYTSPSYTVPSFSIPSYTPSSTWQSCSEFGMATYSYLSGKCECMSGYTVRNNRCISNGAACQEDYGYNATSSYNNKCTCRYGYKFNNAGTKCISNDDYCQELDWNSEWDILSDSCKCGDGYVANSSKNGCVRDSSNIPNYLPSYVPTTTYTCPPHSTQNPLDPSSCPCDAGYKVSADKSLCLPIPCPKNSYEKPTDNTICICSGSFQWNASKTACLLKPVDSKNTTVTPPKKVTTGCMQFDDGRRATCLRNVRIKCEKEFPKGGKDYQNCYWREQKL